MKQDENERTVLSHLGQLQLAQPLVEVNLTLFGHHCLLRAIACNVLIIYAKYVKVNCDNFEDIQARHFRRTLLLHNLAKGL